MIILLLAVVQNTLSNSVEEMRRRLLSSLVARILLVAGRAANDKYSIEGRRVLRVQMLVLIIL